MHIKQEIHKILDHKMNITGQSRISSVQSGVTEIEEFIYL